MKTRSSMPFHLLIKPAGPSCNLCCDYCFYLQKDALYPGVKPFRMSDEVLAAVTRQYIEAQPGNAGEVSFGWQGGEPTLMGLDFFRRTIALQKEYARAGMPVGNSLQTNGTLLDDQWAAFLHDEGFLVGLSVDGPEGLHDRFRRDANGSGSFAAMMSGLDVLKRHKVEFNTLTVVQSDNAEHPAMVYDFLKGIGSTFLQFIPVVEPVPGGCAGERSVRPDQLGRFLCGVFDRWLEYDDVGRVFVQLFDTMLNVVMGYPSPVCVSAAHCGRALAVEHNGDVYSCDHFVNPGHLLGNVMTRPLAEMVDGEFQSRFGRNKSDLLPVRCRGCEFLRYCYGQCPKDRLAPDGVNHLCAGFRMFYSHSLPVFERMAACLRSGRPACEYKSIL